MSDPKAMTLEEAVEIVAWGRENYSTARWCEAFNAFRRGAEKPDAVAFHNESNMKWDRARAIVDQAVRFVKAREQEWDGLTPHPGAIDEFYKLRAMQRGEEASRE